MNRNLSILAGALALALSGQASASLTQANTPGGSSLTLSVWDSVLGLGYTRNLGFVLNSFLPSGFTTLPNDGTVTGTAVMGDKTPAAGLNLSFPGDALFGSTFGQSDAANISWNIVAVDNQSSAGSGLSRVITTTNGSPGTTNAGMGLIGGGYTTYTNALLAQTTIGSVSVNSAAITDSSLESFAGRPTWGGPLNGGLQQSSIGTGYGGTLDFYYLARTQVSGVNSTLANKLQFANEAGPASWTLASDGTATYAVSAVPLPAAVWLMGSGLVAVLAAARRRKQPSVA